MNTFPLLHWLKTSKTFRGRFLWHASHPKHFFTILRSTLLRHDAVDRTGNVRGSVEREVIPGYVSFVEPERPKITVQGFKQLVSLEDTIRERNLILQKRKEYEEHDVYSTLSAVELEQLFVMK
eukprot:PhF_6_TR30599/c0_g1_i1/m.45037